VTDKNSGSHKLGWQKERQEEQQQEN
jgi:hypothetical protein